MKEVRKELELAYEELDIRNTLPTSTSAISAFTRGRRSFELAAQQRYDARSPKFNTAKAAVLGLREMNYMTKKGESFAALSAVVEEIDKLLRRPGLGEWYDKPGLNLSSNFYRSPELVQTVSLLTAQGGFLPNQFAPHGRRVGYDIYVPVVGLQDI